MNIHSDLSSPECSPVRKKTRSHSFNLQFSSQPSFSTTIATDRVVRFAASQNNALEFLTDTTFPDSSQKISKEIFNVLKHRCGEHVGDLRYWDMKFHPLFRRDVSQSDYTSLIWKLIHKPLTVSNEELNQMFKLNRVTEDTGLGDSHTVYYVRTFPILASQLESILTTWQTSNRSYDVVPNWALEIATMRRDQGDGMLYVRYVGMSREGSWVRLQRDLAYRNNGILGAFVAEVTRHHPHILDDVRCHEFVDLSFPAFPSPSSLQLDIREKILISLFNLNVLLNRQSGGYYSQYLPCDADHVLFNTLSTNFFDSFAASVDTDRSQMRSTVHSWAARVRDYAMNHPDETLTHRFPITDNYFQAVLRRQAEVAPIRNKALIVLIGKDVTIEDINGTSPFLSGESRAGKLTMQIIRILHAWEHNLTTPLLLPFIEGQFPFIDLFPYIGHSHPDVAAEFVQRYLRETGALIGVTFSQTVSSWAAAHFLHGYGFAESDFLQNVGIPRLSSYARIEWVDSSDEPPEESWYIQVPHIHPGRDKYGNQPESLRRVILLSWMATILIADLMLDEHDLDGLGALRVCERVIAKFQQRGSQLLSSLNQAKAKLRKEWQQANFKANNLTTAQRRQISQDIVAKRILRNGYAQGLPGSVERKLQVERLWRMNLRDIHLHLGRDQREKWYQWAINLAQDKSYFCSALASSNTQSRLVKQMALPGTESMDAEAIKKAYAAAGERLRSGWKTDHNSPEKQRQRRLGNMMPTAHEDMNLKEVKVWAPYGKVRFYWSRNEGKQIVAITLPGSRSFVIRNEGEQRLIEFVERGLNLLDGEGNVLLSYGKVEPPTWEKRDLNSAEGFEDIRACWEHHTGLTWEEDQLASNDDQLAPDPSNALPAEYFIPLGHSLLKRKTDVTKCAQPPTPGEGTWIINQFLNSHFGDEGGRLVTGTAEGLNERYREDHVKLLLRDFLQRPEYANYPWKRAWMEILESPKTQASTSDLRRNIEFCREIVSTKNYTASAGKTEDGRVKNITGKIWQIGGRKPGW